MNNLPKIISGNFRYCCLLSAGYTLVSGSSNGGQTKTSGQLFQATLHALENLRSELASNRGYDTEPINRATNDALRDIFSITVTPKELL